MHILVCNAFRASSQMAYAINTVKMAQGFARLGHRVTIVCRRPWPGRVSPEQLQEVYGLAESMAWVQLPPFINSRWLFGWLAARLARQLQPDLVFARHYVLPWLTAQRGMATVAESHAHVGHRSIPFAVFLAASRKPAFRLLVTISPHLADHFRRRGIPADKLLVLPDAVDLPLFERPSRLPPTPFAARGPHIVYAGHLYDYKGIPTILEAAARLPDLSFHLVGGWPQDIARQQAQAQALGLDNVTFHGLQPQPAIPTFLWHAHVLLLPPSRHHPSAAWTSPLKLGEYLASGTPVVATAIPALKNWVTEEEVEFVPPDDPQALANSIQRLLNDDRRAAQLRAQGLQKAQAMSYKNRAKSILQKYETRQTV